MDFNFYSIQADIFLFEETLRIFLFHVPWAGIINGASTNRTHACLFNAPAESQSAGKESIDRIWWARDSPKQYTRET